MKLTIDTATKCISNLLWLSILLGYNGNGFAQADCYRTQHKEAIKKYREAVMDARFRPTKAYQSLLEATKLDSNFVDAYYLLATTNYTNANSDSPNDKKHLTTKAMLYFEKVISLCPRFHNYDAYYFLAEHHLQQQDYRTADKQLDIFISQTEPDNELLPRARSMQETTLGHLQLVAKPVPFNPRKLEGINTPDDEFLPIISPDNEQLLFTRRYQKTDARKGSSFMTEELFISYSLGKDSLFNQQFQEARPMPEPFNHGLKQGAATLTIDNMHMYITVCELQRMGVTSYTNCDIFTSDNQNGHWTTLKRLGPAINSPSSWEGQPSITADGKVLFFASAREDSYGGLDIYRSVRDSLGNWQPAVNLGPRINTKENDKTPFIHSDSQTLYFATNGRNGVGGYDIYFANYLGNWEWTRPQNIGYPINTVKDEVGFIVSADGQKIYFSSNQLDSMGTWDIYASDLYEEARPRKILFVKGQIVDELGKPLSNSHVELQNLATAKKTIGMVDPQSGKYAVALTLNGDEQFVLTAIRDGYMFNTNIIDTKKQGFDIPTTIDISLQPIKLGGTVRLENINFDFNSAQLSPTSLVILDAFVAFLNDNPSMKILLAGHTDSIGDHKTNQTLSERRAKAVYKYLYRNGIQKSRIRYKGYGEDRPVASNGTDQGRQTNRRTEFVVLSQ